jgi:two-component system, cell cycle sensor histidine kinase and response regulator CckA
MEESMTILAVDDEPTLRMLVEAVLRDHGYSVLTAGSGAQALALFREHHEKIDLLLSDIVMPGMDGPSLAAELQMSCPDLKVLLMSGYCDPDQLSYGYEFIPKPFALTDMLAKIEALLHSHSSHAHTRALGGRCSPQLLRTHSRPRCRKNKPLCRAAHLS